MASRPMQNGSFTSSDVEDREEARTTHGVRMWPCITCSVRPVRQQMIFTVWSPLQVLARWSMTGYTNELSHTTEGFKHQQRRRAH